MTQILNRNVGQPIKFSDFEFEDLTLMSQPFSIEWQVSKDGQNFEFLSSESEIILHSQLAGSQIRLARSITINGIISSEVLGTSQVLWDPDNPDEGESDEDGDGLVDGSESSAYQIYNDGTPLYITNRRGATYSDDSSISWDVTQAVSGSSGNRSFHILLEGDSTRLGTYYVWSANASGSIRSGNGGWKTAAQMVASTLR